MKKAFGLCLAVAGLGLVIAAVTPAQAAPGASATGIHLQRSAETARIRALIVQYEPGHAPKAGVVLGASKVTGPQRQNLQLGSALGNRMWRVDFKTPVSEATALRVARQLASHPDVAFAELDRKVSAFR
ncbi:MAG: hypothetical protein KGP12_11525 [Actinomycetales bacterium]|nr:hypothetical protein [Actinomycetales bacterium]